METQKKCAKCKELKDLREFAKDGLYSYCRICNHEYRKELYDKIEKITLEEKK